MDKIQIFRKLFLILSVIGFTLCFIALVFPNWIEISTDAYTGSYGLFIFCVNNYGNAAACSDVMLSNVGDYFATVKVFMCIGFSFYTLYITMAAIIPFWLSRWRVVMSMKYAAAVFAFLSAIYLSVAVILLKLNHNIVTETLSYGWYVTIVSLSIAFIGVPSYIVDAYHTAKPRFYKHIMNVSPRPTPLTEKDTQKMIDSANDQIVSETGQLREKLTLLYNEQETDMAPRPTTPCDNKNKALDVPVSNQTIRVPPAVKYGFGSLYDEDLTANSSLKLVHTDDKCVHRPSKLITDDVSLTDILRKNFITNSALNSPNSSRRSSICLQGGQLDDADLEVYMLSKGFDTLSDGIGNRPPSREAFKKESMEKSHKETTTVGEEKTLRKYLTMDCQPLTY